MTTLGSLEYKGDILPCINGSWGPLTSMKSLFSRRQNTRGGGRPDALHDNVAFSPSRTETSPSEVPEFRMSGGTEKEKIMLSNQRQDNETLKIAFNNYAKCHTFIRSIEKKVKIFLHILIIWFFVQYIHIIFFIWKCTIKCTISLPKLNTEKNAKYVCYKNAKYVCYMQLLHIIYQYKIKIYKNYIVE